VKRVLIVVSIVVLGSMTVACGGDDNGGSTTGAATGGTATGATATGGTATGGTASGTSGSGTTIDVTEKDFAIAVSPSSATSGNLTFSIHNDGPSPHEFVIFNTDLAPDELPTNDDGTVNEEGEGVEHVDEVEDIAPGTDGSLDVSLDPGTYVFICNLPGHYSQGMHVAFTVA
jgi:uncharacterized cupredoxin-like copper-binding protein